MITVIEHPIEEVFDRSNSIIDLLDQMQEFQSRGIKNLKGTYFYSVEVDKIYSVEVDKIIDVINKLKDNNTKEEIYKSLMHMIVGF